MRVDDEVWSDSFSCEGQVFLSVSHTASALLPMATSELVSDLRNSLRSHLDLSETES